MSDATAAIGAGLPGDSLWPNRLFAAGRRADLRAHHAAYGSAPPALSGVALIDEVRRSGLTGRGGAAFPTARKLAALPRESAGPIVIANGAEGEPRSVKDAQLLTDAPHLVLDGLLAVSAAVRATRTYVYAGGAALQRLREAVGERSDARRLRLVESADTFVSGEASAVVNAIERGRPVPVDRTERLTGSGFRGRPTLLHNVETLAHVALVARHGAAWFRRCGADHDPGSRLVTVSGDVVHEGVLEVRGDVPISEVMAAAVWRGRPLAVLVGGYHGAWVPASQLGRGLSRHGLAELEAQPGAGVLYGISDQACGLRATAEIVDYLASQSAGQCGPCRFGLPAAAMMFGDLARGVRDASLPQRIAQTAGSVIGRGACHHPDGTARLIRSALRVFDGDVRAHLAGSCTRGW